MKKVFVLQHEYGPEDRAEQVKFIGVFASRGTAEAAIRRLRLQPGFSEHPEGFVVDEYELDKPQWVEGFVVVN